MRPARDAGTGRRRQAYEARRVERGDERGAPNHVNDRVDRADFVELYLLDRHVVNARFRLREPCECAHRQIADPVGKASAPEQVADRAPWAMLRLASAHVGRHADVDVQGADAVHFDRLHLDARPAQVHGARCFCERRESFVERDARRAEMQQGREHHVARDPSHRVERQDLHAVRPRAAARAMSAA